MDGGSLFSAVIGGLVTLLGQAIPKWLERILITRDARASEQKQIARDILKLNEKFYRDCQAEYDLPPGVDRDFEPLQALIDDIDVLVLELSNEHARTMMTRLADAYRFVAHPTWVAASSVSPSPTAVRHAGRMVLGALLRGQNMPEFDEAVLAQLRGAHVAKRRLAGLEGGG